MNRTARRLVQQAHRRWLEADRLWQVTIREVSTLVPDARTRSVWLTGQAGSRVRQIYERRARAIEALHAAQLACRRAEDRRRMVVRRVVLRLPGPG